MTVRELYDRFEAVIPLALRESWDNDGLMVCPDAENEVRKAIVTLDVTEECVDYAIENQFDLIVSHHPLVFRPMNAMTEDDHVQRKVIKLVQNGVSVFSFHTRADKVGGGVNDCLAEALGLEDARPFGEGDLGRIGTLPEEMTLEDFAFRLKELLGSDWVLASDAYNDVRTVALVGGDGKGYIRDALEEGADTFLSGRIGYNMMEDASGLGINLIEAGHYFTEVPVLRFFAKILSSSDPYLQIERYDSNQIRTF